MHFWRLSFDADLWCLRNAGPRSSLPRPWPLSAAGSVGTATARPQESAAAVQDGKETGVESVSFPSVPGWLGLQELNVSYFL